jgi:uncharacterized protein YjbI with pentapeptide repeats
MEQSKRMKQILLRIRQGFSDIVERPILVTTLVFCFMFLLVVAVSFRQFLYNYDNFVSNLMAEAFGTVFDLLVIGIFLLWINKLGEKKILLRGYQEEIDDFRNWANDEAMFKIVGNIKRLNKHKVYELELYECHMRNAKLEYVRLDKSNLNFTDLENANLMGSGLSKIRANQVNFTGAKLNDANMSHSLLTGAVFKDSVAIRSDFTGAMLIKADFSGAFLMEANLSVAQLIEADFTDANLYKADLRGAIGLTASQLAKARTIHMAQLDETLLEELKHAAPHFFVDPDALPEVSKEDKPKPALSI